MGGIGSGQRAGREGRRDQDRAAPGAQQATEPEADVLAMSETTPALPVATGGYEQARFNALRHGVLSRYTVLPWEDAAEYGAVLDALVAVLHGSAGGPVGAERRGGVGERPSSDHGCPSCPSS